MNRDGHLAVGLFAQLAAVLVLHADGVLALLGEAGIVEDKDSLGTGEGSSHHGAVAVENLLFVPRTLVDELLQGLFGIANRAELGRERDTADHRLDALAFAILDQTAEVDAAPGTLGLVSKIVLKEPGVIPEPVHDFGGQFGCKGLVHTIHTNKDTGRFVKFNGVVLEAHQEHKWRVSIGLLACKGPEPRDRGSLEQSGSCLDFGWKRRPD